MEISLRESVPRALVWFRRDLRAVENVAKPRRSR